MCQVVGLLDVCSKLFEQRRVVVEVDLHLQVQKGDIHRILSNGVENHLLLGEVELPVVGERLGVV